MISYVLPTRDRHDDLARTLGALSSLPRHDANIIIADNASAAPVVAPRSLANSLEVLVIPLEANRGTAARNIAVDRAVALASSSGRARDDHWIVMLDDDSAPLDARFIRVLRAAPGDVAAIAADVWLPDAPDGSARREAGGLPEVYIGCGAAVRADVFQSLGGYDGGFDYYAEEYDLCARIILSGMRVARGAGFAVRHRKVTRGRNMSRIARNLVRNNAWIMARYAPDAERGERLRGTLARYASIAWRERAMSGYLLGLRDLMLTMEQQPRRAMSAEQWDRFTGRAEARTHLRLVAQRAAPGSVAIVEPGKNVDDVRAAALQAGLRLVPDAASADALLIGTLSPGPMIEAKDRVSRRDGRRVLMAWNPLAAA